jgi:hypothetical protein
MVTVVVSLPEQAVTPAHMVAYELPPRRTTIGAAPANPNAAASRRWPAAAARSG